MEGVSQVSNKPYNVLCPADDRRAWLEARRGGIGASDIGAIMGLNPWKDSLAVYADKLGLGEEESSEAAQLGLALEPAIVQLLISDQQFKGEFGEMKPQREQRLLASRKHSYLRCTLDYRVRPKGGGKPLVVECKRTSLTRSYDEGPPKHVWAQAQQQMLVTGEDRIVLAVLLPAAFRWMVVERDEAFIRQTLIPVAADFWRRVEQQDPPPIKDYYLPAVQRAIQRIYPEAKAGKAIEVDDPCFAEMWRRLEDIAETKRELEQDEAAIRAQIQAAMGDAERMILPGGLSFSWKTQRRPVYERGPQKGETVYRVFRRHRIK